MESFVPTFAPMFSKACEYAIRATLCIASGSEEGRRTGLKEISKSTGSPEAFTAKILRQLVQHKIIDSVKGPSGGFEIRSEKLGRIRLKEIVTAIDGNALFTNCGMGLKSCSDKRPCPLHEQYKEVRKRLLEMLECHTLRDMAERIKETPYNIR